MMIQSVSVAFAVDISVVRSYWATEWSLTAILIVNVLTLSFISVASLFLTLMLFHYNFKPSEEIKNVRHQRADDSGEEAVPQ